MKKIDFTKVSNVVLDNGLKVGGCTSDWVAVYEDGEDFTAYILINEDDELYFYIHLPEEWNGVIKCDILDDLHHFAVKVDELTAVLAEMRNEN